MSERPPLTSMAPNIPTRTSSKKRRPSPGPPSPLKLEQQLEETIVEVKSKHKKLKIHASHDSEFWSSLAEYKKVEHECTKIRREISISDFTKQTSKDKQQWYETAEGARLVQKIEAEATEITLIERQARRVRDTSVKKSIQRAFLKLFVTSSLGLGFLNLGQGRRPTAEQSNFRSNLIEAYDASYESGQGLWCPISGDWIDTTNVTASHIFAWKHGQDTMVTLFGKTSRREMFSPKNGLLLADHIEVLFESGLFVIVPDIPDETQQSIQKWNQNSPKDYKLRLLNPQDKRAAKRVTLTRAETWLDWDGRKLQFRNDFRPRARYLYFHYCCQLLRYAWSQQRPAADKPTPLQHELRKHFWGTPGRYLPRNMLMALVDEMGHQYEELLEGAMKESCPPEQEDLLLGALTKQILSDGKAGDDDEDEDEEDEDEGEEDEDEGEEDTSDDQKGEVGSGKDD